MSNTEQHDFNRRVSDANVASLSIRMGGLEERVEVLEQQGVTAHRELSANTRLTKQSHEAIFGSGDDPGMKAAVDQVNHTLDGDDDQPGLTRKVEDMHAIFEPARNGFRLLGKIGDVGVRISDVVEKRPKTTALLIITGVVSYSLAKTGQLPDWFAAMLKVLIA